MSADDKHNSKASLASRLWLLLTTRQFQPRFIDLWLLASLFCVNPLLWGWKLPLNLTPDAVAYLSLADTGIPAGKLYVPAWGHIDVGAILPPLYPTLITLANTIRPDSIANALSLSSACMLLVSVTLYLFVKRLSGRWIAAGAALLTQLNWHYLFFGSNVLTEPLFLLLILVSLYLLLLRAMADRPLAGHAITLGILAGLAFLTRQVGLVLFIFLLLWFAIDIAHRSFKQHRVREIVLVLTGWTVIVGPYAIALYSQTGSSPFQQSSRLQNYVVHTNDSSLLRNIADNSSSDTSDYVDVYRKRRLLRALLPDSSEMLAFVQDARGGKTAGSMFSDDANSGIFKHLRPLALAKNLTSNSRRLIERLGAAISFLAAASMITAITVSSSGTPRAARLLLPAFIGLYFIGVSLLTGTIGRYFTVLFALLIALSAVELSVILHKLRLHYPQHRRVAEVSVFIVAAMVFISTRTLLDAPQQDLVRNADKLVKQSIIPAGEPAFALLPVYTYLAGGTYRILPNDSLEKVIRYARFTGVRWLLAPVRPEDVIESHFYSNSPWLTEPYGLMQKAETLRYCCTAAIPDRHLVFEILP
jgi:4-amino-4-deoxy-L-arabinose transferase-like glycosyltransferase